MKPKTATINSEVEIIVENVGKKKADAIPILHLIQDKFNYLPQAALNRVCQLTEITPAAISGISTFYSQFRHQPVGEHIIQVCTGTACHVKGAGLVYDAFKRELKIGRNQDTDPEGLFTLQKVACLGCCTLAPVVQIDKVTFGHVQTENVKDILHEVLTKPKIKPGTTGGSKKTGPEEGEIKIGLGSCCIASGSEQIQQTVHDLISASSIRASVKRVGCVGMCHRVPLLEITTPGSAPVYYDRVRPGEVKNIILKHFYSASFRTRMINASQRFFENLINNRGFKGHHRYQLEMRDPQVTAFLGRQHHIVTQHSGQIDPLDLDEYLARDGFTGLKTSILNLSPQQIIQKVSDCRLRGRGGAGFPTGRKWQLARAAIGDKKYIICNGDEGDPGAFMDRMILESYPFRVIEGMIIAAFATGADEGFFYIRAEYSLAVKRISAALDLCRQAGFLGNDILGSGFSLDLKIMEGAGAFVCGEETALIASIEGNRGMPSYRPPYPVQYGLWGKPTLVNNCETFASVPWIMCHSVQSYTGLGTENSKGTKVFSLAGKVKRGGLIEVPMGITIREIVEEIGGGIEHGREFKAVQIGGPSGGCVPAAMADIPVDYESLGQVGAMMGSGGLLVMDTTDCMVDIARYFLTFTCDQTCGKCTFCRIGTKQMVNILENLCAGKGTEADLDMLEEIAAKTRQRSLCGLGKTAPNPILTTLKYFRSEYQAHLQGICPAKRCKDLIRYFITDKCIGCTICAQKCPVSAIPITQYTRHEIRQDLCTKCDTCRKVCPEEAVEIQ